MYIIRNDLRNAYKTHDGWTSIQDGSLIGLHDVLRFTASEMRLNESKLPKGSRFVYFPRRRWKDL